MFAWLMKISDTIFLFVSMTPFGVPVVPLVKRIAATSSSVITWPSLYGAERVIMDG